MRRKVRFLIGLASAGTDIPGTDMRAPLRTSGGIVSQSTGVTVCVVGFGFPRRAAALAPSRRREPGWPKARRTCARRQLLELRRGRRDVLCDQLHAFLTE